MSVTKLDLKITADAKAAVQGLKPLTSGLEDVTKSAEGTESALKGLDAKHKIKVDDQAVENARKEIQRLRQQIRHDLSVDINADTRPAQRRIRQLQGSIRAIDSQSATVEIKADTRDAEDGIAGVGKSLKGLAAGIGIATVGKEILGGAFAADRFQTNFKAVNKVLGETVAIDLEGWAKANGDALNLSQTAVSDATRGLALYGKAAQSAGGDAEDFITSLIEVASNAAAFTGENPVEAVESIGAAMRGEFDSLERFGINLTADKVAAYAMSNGLADAEGNMTTGQRAQATYNVILQEAGPLMGAVATNADSLGSSYADLQQKTSDLSAALGEEIVPALSDVIGIGADLVSVLNDVISAQDSIIEKAGQMGKPFEDFATLALGSLGDIWGFAQGIGQDWKDVWEFGPIASDEEKAVKAAREAAKEKEKSARAAQDSQKASEGAAAAVLAEKDAQKAATKAAENHKKAVDDLKRSLGEAADAFKNIGTNIRTKVDFIIDRDDLIEEIKKSIKGTKTDKPITLPAKFSVKSIAGLTDDQQGLIRNISGFVEQGLEEGARRAEIDPDFDSAAWIAKIKKDAGTLLIEAGVDPKNVSSILASVFGVPQKVPVEAAGLTQARKDLEAGLGAPISAEIKPFFTPLTPTGALLPDAATAPVITPTVDGAAAAATLDTVAAPRVAAIAPKLEGIPAAKTTLDNVAAERTARIVAVAETSGVSAALAGLTEDRFVTIHVSAVRDSPGPGGFDNTQGTPWPQIGPSIVPQLFGSSQALAGVRSAAAQAASWTGTSGVGTQVVRNPRKEPTVLAPKVTPIKVYLDGAEIADHLTLKASRMASASSVRRRA